MPLLDGGMTLRWCGQNGRVTEFYVDNYYTVVRNTAWLKGGAERSDVRPTGSLGQRSLYVSADCSAQPTIMGWSLGIGNKNGSIGLTGVPGTAGVHYEVQLRPNGVVTGQVWG